MRRAFPQILRRFRREEKGAVIVVFVIFAVPLLVLVAAATDLAQMLAVQRQLRGGVDAAALALGTLPALTGAEADAEAEAYIRAHYPGKIGKLASVTVTRVNESVSVTATAEVETAFLRIAGYGTLTVTVSSETIRHENKLEVVMVLDNSGSMASSLNHLQKAAVTLVDTLMGEEEASETVKIGLVPFMGAVNAGVPRGTWWLDEGHLSPLNRENINLGTGKSLFALFDALQRNNHTIKWGGCVRARLEPFDVTDTPPDPHGLDTNTLFTPFFAPDEAQSGVNDYIKRQDVQSDPAKYAYGHVSGNDEKHGPNAMCPPGAIQPLTNVRAAITDAIGKMKAVGQTVIPEGLAWGWRVISPGEPFTEGVAYTHTGTIKAIVIMTDGDNQVCQNQCSPRQNAENESYFSAYGYTKQATPHLGANAVTTLDAKLRTVCGNIKAIKRPDGKDAITIYSITFGDPSQSTRALMRGCASDAGKYFHSPDKQELQSAFESIAIGLNQLRMSK